MKVLLFFLFTILFLPTNTYSQFRKTTWGMSQQEVKDVETAKFNSEDEKSIYYDGNVGGMSTYIFYGFAENKLVNGGYMFNETHSNKTEFINDYTDLQKILIEKYGNPDDDDKFWYDDLYKDDPQDWGMAIATGDLAYQSIWKSKKTTIMLKLTGDNYKISFAAVYKSVELENLIEEEKKAKNKDDF